MSDESELVLPLRWVNLSDMPEIILIISESICLQLLCLLMIHPNEFQTFHLTKSYKLKIDCHSVDFGIVCWGGERSRHGCHGYLPSQCSCHSFVARCDTTQDNCWVLQPFLLSGRLLKKKKIIKNWFQSGNIQIYSVPVFTKEKRFACGVYMVYI